MLLSINSRKGPLPLTVFAYDIASGARARKVRKILDSVLFEKQYSVYECFMSQGKCNGVLAELNMLIEPNDDSLMTWRSLNNLRIISEKNKVNIVKSGIYSSENAHIPENTGNFIVTYDVADPQRLCQVHKTIAAESIMLQKSVYWLRVPFSKLRELLENCLEWISPVDRLWAYPLSGCDAIWQIGNQNKASSFIPINTSKWSKS